MKITWSDQQKIAQQISGLTDSTTLIRLKRDINLGAEKFLANLGREYNRHSRFADLVSGQQFYQLPEDAFKLKELIVNTGATGGYRPPMEQIPDEWAWNMMNMLSIKGQPTHYWIRGNNEFGLYPTPANTVTSGIQLVFSSKHIEMTQDDFKDTSTPVGTVAITQNTTTLVHSNFGFKSTMVGLWFQNTDGSDENWYQIASYTNPSTLELANVYQGTTITNSSFRIGQVMELPEAWLEAPVDYAMYRHFLIRGDANKTAEFKALWQDALDNSKNVYANVTESQVINAEPRFRIYNPWRGDPPPSITS